MISGDRCKLGPNPGRKPERSVRRTLGAASDASVLACCTGQAQTRPSATSIRGISVQMCTLVLPPFMTWSMWQRGQSTGMSIMSLSF